MFKYKELNEDVIDIAALLTLQNVVVGLAGTHINAIDDLKGKVLGYLRGAKVRTLSTTILKFTNMTLEIIFKGSNV